MSRFDRAMSPAALLIAILALIVATSAWSAYAAARITTAQIKNGAITSAKIKNNAVDARKIKDGSVRTAELARNAVTGDRIRNGTISAADLAPATIASLTSPPVAPAPPTYWAYVTQSGSVGRGSPGVTSEAQLNGGYWQYRITFPRDVSTCGYQVSSGDGTAIGSNEYVIPSFVGVARSTQGPQVLAVNVFSSNNGASIQDTFFIAVHC